MDEQVADTGIAPHGVFVVAVELNQLHVFAECGHRGARVFLRKLRIPTDAVAAVVAAAFVCSAFGKYEFGIGITNGFVVVFVIVVGDVGYAFAAQVQGAVLKRRKLAAGLETDGAGMNEWWMVFTLHAPVFDAPPQAALGRRHGRNVFQKGEVPHQRIIRQHFGIVQHAEAVLIQRIFGIQAPTVEEAVQVDKPLQYAACWKIGQRRHFGEIDLCEQGQRLVVGVARIFCVGRQIGQPADFALAQGQIAAGLDSDFGSGFLGSENGRFVGSKKGMVGLAHDFSFGNGIYPYKK